MSEQPELARARADLGRRQRAVLDDLVAGRTPTGFDPVGARLTSAVLVRKRAAAVLAVCPELDLLPDWRDRFARWARVNPLRGCAHVDAAGFCTWLTTCTDEPAVAGWLPIARVHSGQRRWGLGRLNDGARTRRTLALGWRETVWLVPDPGHTVPAGRRSSGPSEKHQHTDLSEGMV